MARKPDPQIITANDLVDGDAVFLGRIGWVRDIASARVAEDPEDVEMLQIAAARAVRENLVVGTYLVPVRVEAGIPVPLERRERIRAAGAPTFAYAGPGRIARAA